MGWIGLGDQGLPMARAIAEAGFPLHAWARRPVSLEALSGVPHVRHGDVKDLAAASDIVALCVGTDDDVLRLAEQLLEGLRPGSVLVNHGTGLPSAATRLTQMCAAAGVEVLDAPVSGGRPAAEEHRLTTMVGGSRLAFARCEPLFAAFSRHVVPVGAAGAGQLAKLFNNALMMMNQAAIEEIVDLATDLELDVSQLLEVLKLGSASSTVMGLLNTMITSDTVEHLSGVEVLDMELFDQAMRERGIDSAAVTARGLSGARGLPELVGRLNT